MMLGYRNVLCASVLALTCLLGMHQRLLLGMHQRLVTVPSIRVKWLK